ncbi:MAG: DUF6090 family protein [Bacteroidota bacterium]
MRKIWRYGQRNFSRFFIEILIIMVGILLSLAFSSWLENRKDRKEERVALEQIKENLLIDLVQLENNLDLRQKQLAFSQQMLGQISNDTLRVDPATFVQGMRYLAITVSFSPNTVTFETLKSTGQLDLIEDKTILEALVSLYQLNYGDLALNNNDMASFRERYILPFILENFDLQKSMGGTLSTQDFQPIMESRSFINLLTYVQISGSSSLQAYEKAIEQAQTLLELLSEKEED